MQRILHPRVSPPGIHPHNTKTLLSFSPLPPLTLKLRLKLIVTFTLTLSLFSVPPLHADTSTTPSPSHSQSHSITPSNHETTSLAQAIQTALDQNWDVLSGLTQTDIAQAQRLAARELPNPTLSLSTSKISVDGAHGSSTPLGNRLLDRSYDSVITLSQLIEIGGKRSARKQAAHSAHIVAQEQLADTRRLVRSAVTQAYVGVLQADEKARIIQDSAASLRTEAQLATLRMKSGDISTNDSAQIEMAADRLELEVQQALTDAAAARAQLQLLLGQTNRPSSIQLSDSLSKLGESLNSTPPDPESSTDKILGRPDVRAASAQVDQSLAALKLQKAQRIPDPTFSATYEHEPAEQPHTVGIAVSFPLPLWNHNRSGIAAARASAEQARINAAKTTASAFIELSNAWRDFTTSRNRHEEYASRIVPKSQSVREAVTFAYRKGGATLLDLLSAQRNDNEIRLASILALGDWINAGANLNAALNLPYP